ncbi:MAG TPA: NnrU family protein [Alphaproteobacteria bacterium]|nr:NnrU family protein [Alphaproteobacteria bacterium]
MTALLLAAAFLLLSHYGISSTALRPALVGRIGEGPYRGLFSLVALGALVLLARSYAAAPYVETWGQATPLRWLPVVLVPLALLLVVGGVLGPNPTAMGQQASLDDPAGPEPRGLQRITRHPMMWGIGLWALAHAGANGDAAALVFFGSFAVLALLGTRLLDAKNRHRAGWAAYAGRTSNLPFAAILAGRQRLVPAEIGWRAPATALVLTLALAHLHGWLFGVPAFG